MSEETPTPEETPASDATPTGDVTKEEVMEVLMEVYDPDLGISIVDLGLVYDVRIDGTAVEVDMTLTSPACPYGPQMIGDVQFSVKRMDGVETVDVELVWDPPWTMERVSLETRLDLGLDY